METKLPVVHDDMLLQNFVNPQLCKQLFDHGLFFALKFYWVVRGNRLELISKAFDPDDYYADSMLLMDAACPLNSLLPAYSIKEMEKLLPSYSLAQHKGCYGLKLANIPQLSATGTRMPDVFAAMLLKCIEHDVISLDKANLILMD